MGGVGWFFSDYRVSTNFFVVLGLRLWLRLGLGCDNMSLNGISHMDVTDFPRKSYKLGQQ